MPKLLSPAQVEREYGISTRLLGEMRYRRRGPAYHKLVPSGPGSVRYDRAEIERWLEATKVETSGSAA